MAQANDIEYHIARLMASNAEPQTILALAQACSPLDMARTFSGKNLLRLAIERSSYSERWSVEQLDALASCGGEHPDLAWANASRPDPLAHWLSTQLGSNFRQGPEVACRILSKATLAEISSCPGNRKSDSLLSGLLAASKPVGDEGLGFEPAKACARAMGIDLATHRIGRMGAEPQRALLLAQSAEAFDFASTQGVDFNEHESGKPLWLAWREAAAAGRNEELVDKLSRWGARNDAERDEAIRRDAYFKSLGNYRGEDHLRDRSDWTSVRDERGRTSMMALALGNGASIKSWMAVKKALPAAAARDNDGRTLWHCLLAKGKAVPLQAANYLRTSVPLELDALGRGLVPSMLAMLDANGRPPSEHEMLFNHDALAAAAKGQSAHLWFACPDQAEALKIGDWIANRRYLGSKGESPQSVRSGACLSALCAALDPLSLSAIPSPIAGALAINLATSRVAAPECIAAAAQLLGAGGYIELTEERQHMFDAHAHPDMKALVREAFFAATESRELRAHLPEAPGAPRETHTRRI